MRHRSRRPQKRSMRCIGSGKVVAQARLQKVGQALLLDVEWHHALALWRRNSCMAATTDISKVSYACSDLEVL
jgi:hypothetical protein